LVVVVVAAIATVVLLLVVLAAVEVLVLWPLGLQEQQVKDLPAELLLRMQAIQQHPVEEVVDLLQ
jgi:hypothetical protein